MLIFCNSLFGSYRVRSMSCDPKILLLCMLLNNIECVIPYQMSNLQKVWYLDFGANYLGTPDWSKLRNMPVLKHLSFGYNELRSEFLEFVLHCHNLTYLDLSINHLNDSIPETVFSNLNKLERLNLSSHLFQGSLSPNFTQVVQVKRTSARCQHVFRINPW